MTDQELGARIIAARKHLGVQQNEFAAMIDVSPSTLSRWESGTYSIDALDLLRIAEVSKLPINFFLPITFELYWYQAYCNLVEKIKTLAQEAE